MPGFARVAVTLGPSPSAPRAAIPESRALEERIEIVLGNGRCVVVPVSVDLVALGRLLPIVEGA